MPSGLSGVRDLDRALARIALVDRPEVAERALRAGGEVIAKAARDKVHVRSGQTRDSIAVGKADVTAGEAPTELRVGPSKPDGWRAHFEEFGTEDTPAHPFMRPAYDENRVQALDAAAKVVEHEVAKAAKG